MSSIVLLRKAAKNALGTTGRRSSALSRICSDCCYAVNANNASSRRINADSEASSLSPSTTIQSEHQQQQQHEPVIRNIVNRNNLMGGFHVSIRRTYEFNSRHHHAVQQLSRTATSTIVNKRFFSASTANNTSFTTTTSTTTTTTYYAPQEQDPHTILIDGSVLAQRAYKASKDRKMRSKDGTPTNALFSFIKVILSLSKSQKDASYNIAVFFDSDDALREPVPEELAVQLPLMQEALQLLGIQVIEVPAMRATDMIAAYAVQANTGFGHRVTIISSDRSMLQLVKDGVIVYDPAYSIALNAQEVFKRCGVPPSQVIQLHALTGYSASTATGIGPQLAAQLLKHFGNLETVMKSLHKISNPALQQKLKSNFNNIKRLYVSMRLRQNIAIPIPLEELQRQEPDVFALIDFLDSHNMKSIALLFGIEIPPPQQLPKASKKEPEEEELVWDVDEDDESTEIIQVSVKPRPPLTSRTKTSTAKPPPQAATPKVAKAVANAKQKDKPVVQQKVFEEEAELDTDVEAEILAAEILGSDEAETGGEDAAEQEATEEEVAVPTKAKGKASKAKKTNKKKGKKDDNSPRTVLVDGTGFAYRAFYGTKNLVGKMTSRDGVTPTNAVFTYVKMMLAMILNKRKPQPDNIAIFFDQGRSLHRLSISADYKATREATPEELKVQIPLIMEATESLGIKSIVLQGVEADDLIASYAEYASSKLGHRVTVVSPDKDMLQLVNDKISIYDPVKSKTMDAAAVKEKFGVLPSQLPDLQALIGDSVDNVSGVDGIGPKTAAMLIQQFGSVESLMKNYRKIKNPLLKDKIRQNIANIKQSYALVKLVRNMELPVPFDELKRKDPDSNELLRFLHSHNMRSIIKVVKRLKWNRSSNRGKGSGIHPSDLDQVVEVDYDAFDDDDIPPIQVLDDGGVVIAAADEGDTTATTPEEEDLLATFQEELSSMHADHEIEVSENAARALQQLHAD